MMRIIDEVINAYFRQGMVNKGKSWVARSLISRFFKKIVCTSREGLKFEIDPGDIVQLSILTTGEWEPAETEVIKKHLKPGQVFYDIGANHGYFTLLAANLIGEDGHVYAFEPNPRMVAALERNIALNSCSNITVIPYAVSDLNGMRNINIGGARNSGLTSFRNLEEISDSISIRTIRLDDYVEKNSVQQPDFIKLDIEGAELLAISGMKDMLTQAEHVKLLLEVSDRFLRQAGGSERELLEILSQCGFSEGVETSRHIRIEDDGKPFQYNLFLEK